MTTAVRDRLRKTRVAQNLDRRGVATAVLVAVAAIAFGLIGFATNGAASSYYYYCPGGGSSYTYCPGGSTVAELIVIKHVINDDGGVAVASDFTISINLISAQGGSVFPGEEAPGTKKTVSTGNYTVTETGPIGYDGTFSADCDAVISAGETKTCTITNDDKTPEQKLADLEGLVDSLDLPSSLDKSLDKDLAQALEKLATKPEQSCDSLDAFLTSAFVAAAAEQPPLTIAEAKPLIAAANDIELAIGCFAPGSPRPGAEAKLLDVIDKINTVGLSSGVAKDLRNKTRIAATDLIAGKDICKQLADLQGTIAKYLSKGTVTASQASQLSAEVAAVQADLGC